MSNLGTGREVAKFFAMSSINLRPEACQLLLNKTSKMTYSDEKKDFLNKFLKYFKEWQSLNQKQASINKQIGAISADDAILDAEITVKILSHMNLNTSGSRTSAVMPEPSPQKKTFGSFKSMKRDKQLRNLDDDMKNAGTEDTQMDNEASELNQIRSDLRNLQAEEAK